MKGKQSELCIPNAEVTSALLCNIDHSQKYTANVVITVNTFIYMSEMHNLFLKISSIAQKESDGFDHSHQNEYCDQDELVIVW